MSENQIDKVYEKLLGKGEVVGTDLYYLTGKQITPAIRQKINERNFGFKAKETFNFRLREKADVTGNVYDTGWILKDKRQDNIARGFVKQS